MDLVVTGTGGCFRLERSNVGESCADRRTGEVDCFRTRLQNASLAVPFSKLRYGLRSNLRAEPFLRFEMRRPSTQVEQSNNALNRRSQDAVPASG